MLKQGNVDWTIIDKISQGASGWSPGQITVSLNKNGPARKRVVLAIPKAILTSAGMKMNDYVNLKYCNGICEIDRVADRNSGFKISGGQRDCKGRISFRADAALISAFFDNGTKRYCSPLHETRPNSIQFSIGKDAVA